MRVEFKEKIGSNVYYFRQLRLTPARELWAVLGELVETISAPLSKTVTLDENLPPGVVGAVIGSLAKNFGASAGRKALDLIFAESHVQQDGKDPKLPLANESVSEEVFGEHFEDLVPFLWFALTKQFGRFIPSLVQLVPAAAREKAATAAAKLLKNFEASTTSVESSSIS